LTVTADLFDRNACASKSMRVQSTFVAQDVAATQYDGNPWVEDSFVGLVHSSPFRQSSRSTKVPRHDKSSRLMPIIRS